ncbi:MAG: short-chain fatty acyl-CoA regulator family protein, partial [Pseudomonadota bacterium]
GLRIRERRKAIGLSQSALAQRAGISPSYLNLIEHNKRAIAGRVLLALARELDVPPASLSQEAELSMIAEMRTAAAEFPVVPAEVDVTEEFASRFPGWARLVGSLHRQVRDQRAAIDALSDRLAHDPVLQANMHEMLTNITAIRSTAGILTSLDDVPAAQQRRFIENIHAESQRLSEVAQSLTAYFDEAASSDAPATSPDEELDRFLAARSHAFPGLEEPGPGTTVSTIIAEADDLTEPEARQRATRHLERYAADAAALPQRTFLRAVAETSGDVLALAGRFGVPLQQVMRRLMGLPGDAGGHGPYGGVRINAAGTTLMRKTLGAFTTPRHGAPCALWPLYTTLAQPGRPIAQRVALPGGDLFDTVAVAEYEPRTGLSDWPRLSATMLVRAATSGAEEPLEIGTACRLCPRPACPARVEDPILGPVMAPVKKR